MEGCLHLKIEKWDHRHWAVYEGPELVCVTVYKKGAVEVKRRLESIASPEVETASSAAFRELTSKSNLSDTHCNCVTLPSPDATGLSGLTSFD